MSTSTPVKILAFKDVTYLHNNKSTNRLNAILELIVFLLILKIIIGNNKITEKNDFINIMEDLLNEPK